METLINQPQGMASMASATMTPSKARMMVMVLRVVKKARKMTR